MNNQYKNLLNHLLASLNKKDIRDLKAYYSYYQEIEKDINALLINELQNHPEFGSLIRNQSDEAREEQRQASRHFQYEAIYNNKWEPYIEYQAEQGIAYARMGIEFYMWYDVLAMVRNYMMPKLLAKGEGNYKNTLSIINGTNRFFDIAMCAISEAYLNEKKAIIEEQKNEQEKINRQLKRTVSIVDKKNQELEQFAYVASHDLQEPLRMVTSFLTQLNNRYSAQLDDKARKYIEFAVDGASRMRVIILDLLEYYRVGNNEPDFGDLNMNEILQEAIQLNKKVIDEKNAVIRYGELPVIQASKTPLQQVLQNLIGNALKYHHPNKNPAVNITASETSTHWQFSVSDNGIGIDSEYFDKIFLLFQRLHAKDEYSGTGIGLALCKKIIENHGGEIWVESEPKNGSTFHFTIRNQLKK